MEGTEIVFSNLAEENRRFPDCFERRFAWLSEAAELLLPKEEIGREELSGVLCDVGREFLRALSASRPSFTDAPELHIRELSAMTNGLFEGDAVIFADRVSGLLTARGLFSLSEEAPLTPPFTVAYVRNPASELAFSRMRCRFPDMLPYYTDSFRAAAEAVTERRASACFLPTEDHLFQRIPTFFSILDLYSFRILARETADENGASFALLSDKQLMTEDGGRYLSCRYIPSEEMQAGSVLRAAAFLGLLPIRLYQDMSPAGDRASFVLTAEIGEGGRPHAFLTYLYLFSASVYFYGIYG